ncbi:nucleoside-diphosphate-sugar epimerase [Delitschia confertaspora ATCC 74209]|uniref:Nucleoside-diphosphate-sugar epimerase n=1 Tax=Delitschia confertaspora ATCC 74209 TaxID=1513339 RepID=A0A9P4MRF7_9PLEO|nr:nucleoside-diphosphate-sugar epimerase [Delitschia confertaspora ATCC 74209]
MDSKIFMTGTTGYIGGTLLDTLVTNHPEYTITVLLRTVPSNFPARYPNVKIVRGDYDNFKVLSNAASEASIVIHSGDSDHEPSINALIAGLLRRPSSAPSFLIHLSGTAVVSDFLTPTHLGRLNPKTWSDTIDIDTIVSRPDSAPHRNVDKIIQAAAAAYGDKLKTAIICPPDIYGAGRGLGRTRSVFLPMYLKEMESVGGRPFYVGEGGNMRSWVHMEDLMELYLRLVEAAVEGGSNATWGKEGYYFAASQEHSQRSVAQAVGKILEKHGFIENKEPVKIELEQVDEMLKEIPFPGVGRYLFASNSRTRADRAKGLFGYEPKAPTLFEALEEDLLVAKGGK